MATLGGPRDRLATPYRDSGRRLPGHWLSELVFELAYDGRRRVSVPRRPSGQVVVAHRNRRLRHDPRSPADPALRRPGCRRAESHRPARANEYFVDDLTSRRTKRIRRTSQGDCLMVAPCALLAANDGDVLSTARGRANQQSTHLMRLLRTF